MFCVICTSLHTADNRIHSTSYVHHYIPLTINLYGIVLWSNSLDYSIPMRRPTQSIMYVSLQVNRFRISILLIVQYKHMFRRFVFSKIWSSAWSSWVFRFHQTTLVWSKCFVPQLYQFRSGISGGPALKYFYMIHRGGRNANESFHTEWFIELFIELFHNELFHTADFSASVSSEKDNRIHSTSYVQ